MLSTLWLTLLLACAPKAVLPAVPSPVVGAASTKLPDGLVWYVLQPGHGRVAQRGDKARVAYVGWIQGNPTPFDGNPEGLTFTVGGGQVIKGWDEGVEGMQIGEHRQLVIPAALGYGAAGAGGVIPPNATLVFEVALLALTP